MITTTEYNKFFLNHQENSRLPTPYLLIQNKQVTASFNYEIILPIVFIVLFLLILFIVYLANTYCFKANKSNDPEASICCFYSSEMPRSVVYSQINPMNIQVLRHQANNKRLSTDSADGSSKYNEEPRTGFYHIHKHSNNPAGRAYTLNHNYDKIYDSHPSNLILAIQQRNLINQSENSTGYELPSIEEALPLCNQVEGRAFNPYEGIQHGQFILDASGSSNNNRNFILKTQRRLSASAQKEMENGLYKELSVLRRSYSNSRINYDKWQRIHGNQDQTWHSKIMSESQMKTFLARKNAAYRQGISDCSNNSKLHSFQMLRKEGLMAKEGRLSLKKNLRNISLDEKLRQHHHIEQIEAPIELKSMTNEEKTSNSEIKSLNNIPITKSYSGILGSNREFSSYFENQENTLNKSELNLNKNILHLDQNPCRRKTKNGKPSQRKSSSYIQSRQLRSSTLKINDTNNNTGVQSLYEPLSACRRQTQASRESNLINKLNSKIKEKKVRGARLCKSFTFLSQRVVEGCQERNFARQLDFGISPKSRKITSVFISEPNQLSIWPESLKNQQSNYLKNLDAFKLKSGYLSSNSNIYEAAKSVSILATIRNRGVKDAAVQTSIMSEGSSFNSQVTTLMQTNNYGSIIGNFGSASIHQNAVRSKGMRRLRAYSEGNFLSDSVSSNESTEACTRVNQSIVLLPHSASFSTIMYSKVETFI